ncbi:transcription factor bHLH149 isoform X2 [Rhodamnia argentea]|uniref:Transcription factor bHLH149 isoform X2 n=1 Tax=Rhodamnia argentea TaxID=178133 RepID=A0ABM3GWE0_9MYRT|nr:transcription factor bHLH149 isoform X2 [Rhodamnia argentea]
MIRRTSMASSSPAFSSETAADSHRKKRRKIEADDAGDLNRNRKEAARSEIKWRAPTQQRQYSTKLVQALSRSRRSSSSAAAAPSSGAGEVRGIADRVLATAAKGRTRWSRAILASRLRMSRLGKHHRRARAPTGRGRLKKPPPAGALEGGKRRLPAVERRVKVLGRLVPGCRGISVSNLLEETSDYIAALEMQVRAMTVLTHLLSGSG